MVASTIPPLATTSPSTSTMNPTTTEHDFRFPRRPFKRGSFYDTPAGSTGSAAGRNSHSIDSRSPAAAASAKNNANHPIIADQDSPGDWRLQELSLDLANPLPDTSSSGRMSHLLQAPLFPTLRNDMAGSDESLEQLHENDPLATQVWKFFRNTKRTLPNQARLENLTWRMMYGSSRKHKQEQQERYVFMLLRPAAIPTLPAFPALPAVPLRTIHPSFRLSLVKLPWTTNFFRTLRICPNPGGPSCICIGSLHVKSPI